MNNILQLKGKFYPRKNTAAFGPMNLPKDASVKSEHIRDLREQLEHILRRWEQDDLIGGALVNVQYRCVVAKSNRLKILLSYAKHAPNDSIRGAKFIYETDQKTREVIPKHVFTHYVPLDAIQKAIDLLRECERYIDKVYDGEINRTDTEKINNGVFHNNRIAKTNFLKVVIDAYYVEKFPLHKVTEKIRESSIITIYKTDIDTAELLGKLGIDMYNAKMIDETTLLLDERDLDLLIDKAPYLIAMSVRDFAKTTREDVVKAHEEKPDEMMQIADPQNEPVIGVIDTQFDKRVYFHKWVESKNMLDPDIGIETRDYEHGTAVSSIIVDGPTLNPELDDGCGRFRVRHFGVAKAGGFSSFAILKMIRGIVAENRDIKVWNLSLGSAMEIDPNFISPEAAELDNIQSEYDVVFVVAGTNKPKVHHKKMRIGAPADSLNALVVNAVDFEGKPASYTRTGPVLSFFYKPDVSYYGGDGPHRIMVCEPLGAAYVTGTSYAAPWIARKMAYLIHVMGLSREVAKALIIDSAAGWQKRDRNSEKTGYGIVPISIRDILQSRDDEIRFIMTGSIDAYETYTYSIPVPQYQKSHPYFARATLVYFPKNDRNQGVDYTGTEMDIHFGRVIERNGNPAIKSIDCNTQGDEGASGIYEQNARQMFRKWDNVKHIGETINLRARARKAYSSGMWGLSIKTKERLKTRVDKGLPFGIVVTLREMNGVNRIDEFIRHCFANNWLVNEVDVDHRLDIYHQSEEDVDWE